MNEPRPLGQTIENLWKKLPPVDDIANEESIDEEQQQQLRRLQENLNKHSRIPCRYRGEAFSLFCPRADSGSFRAAHAFMQAYAASPQVLQRGLSVMLLGDIGTGKTALGVATLRRIAWIHNVIPWFVDAATLVHDLWSTAENEARREYRSRQVLLIDDLGKEWISKYSRSIIEDVLCGRHADLKSTIVTSNLDVKEMQKAMQAHAWDRIVESYYILEIKAKSWRRLSEGERAALWAESKEVDE